MKQVEIVTLVTRIRIELQKMGGLKLNLAKVKTVIQRETRGNQKDAERVFTLVEALEAPRAN